MSTTHKLIGSSRGYIFLGNLEGAPDFKTLGKATRLGEAGTSLQEVKFDGTEAPSAMLKKGYIAVGPNAEVEVEFSPKGILITPAVDGSAPKAEKVEAVVEVPAVA
jgi:hypothetical protein